MRLRAAAAGPALALAALAATLLAAEIGARLLTDPPRYHSQPLELDPELGFRGIAHHETFVRDERGVFELRLCARTGCAGPRSRRGRPATGRCGSRSWAIPSCSAPACATRSC